MPIGMVVVNRSRAAHANCRAGACRRAVVTATVSLTPVSLAQTQCDRTELLGKSPQPRTTSFFHRAARRHGDERRPYRLGRLCGYERERVAELSSVPNLHSTSSRSLI